MRLAAAGTRRFGVNDRLVLQLSWSKKGRTTRLHAGLRAGGQVQLRLFATVPPEEVVGLAELDGGGAEVDAPTLRAVLRALQALEAELPTGWSGPPSERPPSEPPSATPPPKPKRKRRSKAKNTPRFKQRSFRVILIAAAIVGAVLFVVTLNRSNQPHVLGEKPSCAGAKTHSVRFERSLDPPSGRPILVTLEEVELPFKFYDPAEDPPEVNRTDYCGRISVYDLGSGAIIQRGEVVYSESQSPMLDAVAIGDDALWLETDLRGGDDDDLRGFALPGLEPIATWDELTERHPDLATLPRSELRQRLGGYGDDSSVGVMADDGTWLRLRPNDTLERNAAPAERDLVDRDTRPGCYTTWGPTELRTPRRLFFRSVPEGTSRFVLVDEANMQIAAEAFIDGAILEVTSRRCVEEDLDQAILIAHHTTVRDDSPTQVTWLGLDGKVRWVQSLGGRYEVDHADVTARDGKSVLTLYLRGGVRALGLSPADGHELWRLAP